LSYHHPTVANHFRLSAAERTILVGVVAAAVAGFMGFRWGLNRQAAFMAGIHQVNPDDAIELEALSRAYGPRRNSENAEEWIVRDFFKDEKNGVFVDVGANHHQRGSNTFYLETVLGWSGVAIDPQVKFAGGYKEFRPRTTFVPLFVSDTSNQQTTLYVTANDLVASSSKTFTEAFGDVSPTPTTTTTLDDVLDRLKITRVDFLTMDIELAEPRALAGFSIERFKPRLVAIEAHPATRQTLLDYFARHGYSLVGKYWRVDGENFWFAPMGAAR
jgi:FkbM family methyltransferase